MNVNILGIELFKRNIWIQLYPIVFSWTSPTSALKLKATLTVNIFFSPPHCTSSTVCQIGTEKLAAEPFHTVLLEDFQSVGRTPQADRNIWFIHNRDPQSQAVTGA